MCHNRYIEYTLMYIVYECVGYVEYNEYSFMYFITLPLNIHCIHECALNDTASLKTLSWKNPVGQKTEQKGKRVQCINIYNLSLLWMH